MTKQLFEEENTLVSIPYLTWEKVGDKVTGVYVGKVLNSVPDTWGKIKTEYVLKQADGTYIKVGGRALSKGDVDGTNFRIIFGMENVPYGTVLGFKYTEDRDNGKGNPTKIIEVIYPDERTTDMEAVAEYEKLYGASPSATEVAVVDDSTEDSNLDDIEL